MAIEEVQTRGRESSSNQYGRKKAKQRNEIIDNKKKDYVLTPG
jgi:hypothetical protein